jgi:hypothetical protein
VFSVKKNGDSIEMENRKHIDADAVVHNLLKKGQRAGMPERNELLNEHFLENCARPGLREIKQVELYTKWWKFVPLQWRDEICPKPSDETLSRVKTGKAAKAKKGMGQPKSKASRKGRHWQSRKRIKSVAKKRLPYSEARSNSC